MCSCHSIPECCVMFSGVKLSMDRLFYYFVMLRTKGGHFDPLLTQKPKKLQQ